MNHSVSWMPNWLLVEYSSKGEERYAPSQTRLDLVAVDSVDSPPTHAGHVPPFLPHSLPIVIEVPLRCADSCQYDLYLATHLDLGSRSFLSPCFSLIIVFLMLMKAHFRKNILKLTFNCEHKLPITYTECNIFSHNNKNFSGIFYRCFSLFNVSFSQKCKP